MATSASVHGVTWFFDADYTVGSYIDGTPYVVAPSGVTINSITPAFDGSKHGAEKNPLPRTNKVNGFDGRLADGIALDPSLNVADNLPLTLQAGDNICSAYGGPVVQQGLPRIVDLAVLTVVSSAPPANSFRPPWAGTDHSLQVSWSDVDTTFLPRLTDPAVDTPSKSYILTGLDSPLLDLMSGAGNIYNNNALKTQNGYRRGSTGYSNYGRTVGWKTSDTALWLCLDHSEADLEEVFKLTIQQGIDIYGLVKAGMQWSPNGGHSGGRKLLLGIAAKALNNADMYFYFDDDNSVFHESVQIDRVTQTDIDVTAFRDPDYLQSDLGLIEWWSNPLSANERRGSGNKWLKLYRDVNGSATTGQALAAELMGLKEAWNHDDFFTYHDERYWPIEGEGSTASQNKIPAFHKTMWSTHKGATPVPVATKQQAATPSPVAGATYDTSQNVTFTEPAGSTTYYTTDGSEPSQASTEYTGAAIAVSSTTTIKWRTYDDSAIKDPSDIQTAVYYIRCQAPVLSPAGGIIEEAVSVTMTTATAGASIYYTIDNSDPDAGSTLYTGAITVSGSLNIKAIAIAGGLEDSVITPASFFVGDFRTEDQWQNISLDSYTGEFIVEFSAVPASDGIDAVVALSDGSIGPDADSASFDLQACSVQFAPTNRINARDGGGYAQDVPLSYSAGTSYKVKMTINVSSKTYDVEVTPSGGSPLQIATGFSFRTSQQSVTELNNAAFWNYLNGSLVSGDYLAISNFQVTIPRTRRFHVRKFGKYRSVNSVIGMM